MKRHIRFIVLLIKLKLSHSMVFRFSFFSGFIADSIYFFVQLMTFQIIYGHVEQIGDFSRGQMLIFIGTFSMLNALNMSIYFFGILDIPQKIREGELDHYITKPINPLFRLTFEKVSLGSAPLLIFSTLIIAYGVSVEGIKVTAIGILGYVSITLLMSLLFYDLELVLRTIPFFVISATAIEQMEGDMLELNFKIPGVLYKGVFKVLFYFILPYGIMATIPTQWISNTLSMDGFLMAMLTVICFTWFTLWFWKLGLKNYKSASS